MGNRRSEKLVSVHARLFPSDIAAIKKIAVENGLPWQIELRQLIRRALKGEIRHVTMVRDE